MFLLGDGRLGHEGTNAQVVGRFGQCGALLFEHGELFTGALEALRDVAKAPLDE
jgi:hypothetical protein